MTLADRIAQAIAEHGPMPVCVIATTVRKQKAEVIAALTGNPGRFVHNGLKARASRWDVREVRHAAIQSEALTWPLVVERAEEAYVELIRQKLREPEHVVARLALLWAQHGAAA